MSLAIYINYTLEKSPGGYICEGIPIQLGDHFAAGSVGIARGDNGAISWGNGNIESSMTWRFTTGFWATPFRTLRERISSQMAGEIQLELSECHRTQVGPFFLTPVVGMICGSCQFTLEMAVDSLLDVCGAKAYIAVTALAFVQVPGLIDSIPTDEVAYLRQARLEPGDLIPFVSDDHSTYGVVRLDARLGVTQFRATGYLVNSSVGLVKGAQLKSRHFVDGSATGTITFETPLGTIDDVTEYTFIH